MLSIAGHEKIKLLSKCKGPHVRAQHNDNVQHALRQAIWDRYTHNKTIPPSFQNTGHCPKAKAPTEPGRKRKRKEDMLQKYIKKTERWREKNRDLFTLKYEYFHFLSIKKDLFTLKYSQAYTFKKLQYLFLLFIEIEHFHCFCI